MIEIIKKNYKLAAWPVIENAPMSILVIDKQGKIIFVNKFFSKISKSKNPFLKSIFKTDFFIREKLRPLYRTLLKTGKSFKKEDCVSDDGLKYLSIIAIPFKNSEGKIEGAFSMATDVTETVKGKLELQKLNLKLKNIVLQKTKELQRKNGQLKNMLERKSQFISDASHEIRTPLAIAKLNLDFLKEGINIDDKKTIGTLESVDNEINKITDTLSDLSLLTSIDEETFEEMAILKFDLNEVLENTIKRTEILAKEKSIKIFFKKHTPVFIEADKKRIEKLFLNIIRNAIKYGKKDGWIKIISKKSKSNKFITISFKDNGIGIAKQDLPYVFDRFYRGTEASKHSAEGGFGLGLAICKWIVVQHNGRICVESKLGQGTTFIVDLPIDKSKNL